jgi:hypothetical protein
MDEQTFRGKKLLGLKKALNQQNDNMEVHYVRIKSCGIGKKYSFNAECK